MILLDVANKLKKDFGYDEIPLPDLVDVLRDGFEAAKNLFLQEGIGTTLQIPKFGSFKVIKRNARIGHNPQTMEKINIPEKIALKFKASLILKTALSELKQVREKKKAKKK